MVRFRVLAAGLVLSAAGCMLFGLGALSRRITSAPANPAAIEASPMARAQASPGETGRFESKAAAASHARAVLAGLPLMFEPNQGQANLDPNNPRAQFVARGSGYSLFLGSEGAILTLHSSSHSGLQSSGLQSENRTRQDSKNRARATGGVTQIESVEMKLAAANPHLKLSGDDQLPGKSNYLIGNDPSKWRRGISQFARVRYKNVYPGINLVFYGNQGRLEYDFQVAPRADPAQAELEFKGAKRLELKDGALLIEGKGGSLQFDAPRVYQQIAGHEQPVEGGFVLRGANRAGFAIGPYDHSRELVIDPVLTYSTYFGGSGNEAATSVAVQGGFIYIAGATDSPNLPTETGVYQPALKTPTATNVYVAEINPNAGAGGLVYVTYLGGSGTDTPAGIEVDGAGNAYVAGTTSSTNFPVSLDAYQQSVYSPQLPSPGNCSSVSTGPQHVFASVLNNTATALNYSTYLSGNGNDCASGMTIDAAGHIFVTGTTTSSNASSSTVQFPASGVPFAIPYQLAPFNPIQFFVTEVSTIDASGVNSIAYSTYFGGASTATSSAAVIAEGGGIAVDTNGNIYFTGTTNFIYQGGIVGDFPILNAYQPCLDTPPPTIVINPPVCTYTQPYDTYSDAFVAKLNPTLGSQLQWSTYLGGSNTDSGTGIALDTGGNVYVTGSTNSSDFVANATSANLAPYQRCLNNEYTGSAGAITCTATNSLSTPYDAFVAKLSNPASGSASPNISLTYFSYLGGSNDEAGLAITVDNAEGALLTGWTQSPSATPPVSGSFPTSSCAEIQCLLAGTQDAYIARINTQTNQNNTQNPLASWVSYFGGGTPDAGNSQAFTQGTSIALDVNQNAYFAGNTDTTNLEVAKALQPANNGGYDAFVTQLNSAYNLSITGVLTLGPGQIYIPAGTTATFVYTLTNGGPDLASNITVTDFISTAYTFVPLTPISISATGGGPPCTSVSSNAQSLSCTITSLQAGSTSTITIELRPTGSPQSIQEDFNGGTVQVIAPNGTVQAQTEVPAIMSDYSLTAAPNDVTVQTAGDTAVYQVQLTPVGIYSSNISLSCTGTPVGSTCTFTTPSVTLLGSSPGATTMNVTTTARPVTPPTASLWSRHFYALWLGLPGLALLGLGVGGDGRRRRVAGMLLLCMMGALLFLPACQGVIQQTPVGGTPAGTYPLTITATGGGNDTKNYTVYLIVP